MNDNLLVIYFHCRLEFLLLVFDFFFFNYTATDILVVNRVKRVTKMSESVITGILSGVVKVSGFVTSSVVNSKVGKKFFELLPGEILLASLDGFGTLHSYSHYVLLNHFIPDVSNLI